MTLRILKLEIRYEHDIVLARQRARSIAGLLGFDRNEQTRLSTAVSEIARNAYLYAKGGEIEFLVAERDRPQLLLARVKDRGPGIEDLAAVLEGRYRSQTGMGLGISGARRLMDYFHIETAAGRGTTVLLGKKMPQKAPVVTAQTVPAIADRLLQQTPQNPFEEIQQQNQELLRTMKELEERQKELEALNRELDDTNRGIVALYAELDEKASSLNRADELKARFLWNMSHEFRTPLNSILALSRLLLDRVDGELNEEQEKQAVFINKAAQDLYSLVNDLLDIAKIEAGKTEVQAAEFEVQNLFGALRGMFKPMLVTPSVNLVFEAPEGLPALCTDEGKVAQILRNFISNAIRFTEKGEIRVSARPAEGGRSVLFSVSDTGIGIAAEHLERIFEEYVQVDSLLQNKTKGTGLGLSLTRKLAELLGGRVQVESAPGVGSTFAAVIPAVYGEAQAGEPMEPAPADITRRPVLVIEDDETMVVIYEKYLNGSGFQVLSVSTLQQARDLIKRSPPVAVIL
ncbi:MAG: histidine kinase, partial [Deltaproteobacteria bacterium]|nr:histidine kinase [Deltaproteobacteria bacterium]